MTTPSWPSRAIRPRGCSRATPTRPRHGSWTPWRGSPPSQIRHTARSRIKKSLVEGLQPSRNPASLSTDMRNSFIFRDLQSPMDNSPRSLWGSLFYPHFPWRLLDVGSIPTGCQISRFSGVDTRISRLLFRTLFTLVLTARRSYGRHWAHVPGRRAVARRRRRVEPFVYPARADDRRLSVVDIGKRRGGRRGDDGEGLGPSAPDQRTQRIPMLPLTS